MWKIKKSARGTKEHIIEREKKRGKECKELSPHAQKQEERNSNYNSKTDIVVVFVCIVPITIRRTTIDIVVVPRAATKGAMDLYLL